MARQAAGRQALSPAVRLAAWPAAFALAQLAFRRAYYGDWLPNTARVRVAFTPERVANGARYLWDAVPELAPLLAAGVAGLVLALRPPSDPETRARRLLVALPAALWCVYVLAIGGDTLHLHRFLVPVLVLLAFAVTGAIAAIGRRSWQLAVASAALLVFAQLALSITDRRGEEWATSELWVLRSESIGRLLGRAFGPSRALLAIDPAGGVPCASVVVCRP